MPRAVAVPTSSLADPILFLYFAGPPPAKVNAEEPARAEVSVEFIPGSGPYLTDVVLAEVISGLPADIQEFVTQHRAGESTGMTVTFATAPDASGGPCTDYRMCDYLMVEMYVDYWIWDVACCYDGTLILFQHGASWTTSRGHGYAKATMRSTRLLPGPDTLTHQAGTMHYEDYGSFPVSVTPTTKTCFSDYCEWVTIATSGGEAPYMWVTAFMTAAPPCCFSTPGGWAGFDPNRFDNTFVLHGQGRYTDSSGNDNRLCIAMEIDVPRQFRQIVPTEADYYPCTWAG